MDTYLHSVKQQFLYYKLIGEKAMAQLEPEQLLLLPNLESNSIAVIIKHLSGNMLSRWTEIFTTDGEKPGRNRDMEFVESIESREALMQKWDAGWACLFHTLDTLETKDLSRIIFIRNEKHTVIEAINRQLAHYPYHVGQIVFYARQLKGNQWLNLSIARNQSEQFNTEKFSASTS